MPPLHVFSNEYMRVDVLLCVIGCFLCCRYQLSSVFPPIKDFGPIEADATGDSGVLFSGRWSRQTASPLEKYDGAVYYSSAHATETLAVTFLMDVPTTGWYKVTFIHPVSQSAAVKVPVSLATAGGTRTLYVNQRVAVRQTLGVFRLVEGTFEISISNDGVPADSSVFVGRIRLDLTHVRQTSPPR